MRKYIAALYSNGKLVTGCNHGDAFGKLSDEDRDGEIESGFFDEQTGRFFTEEYDFYLKNLYMVRHGEAEYPNGGLTSVGFAQAHRVADFLGRYDLSDFVGYVSPYQRCLQTAEIISKTTGIRFTVDVNVRERICHEEHVWSESMDYPQFSWGSEISWGFVPENQRQFQSRISAALASLQAKAVVVSHCDFIVGLTQQAIGKSLADCEEWNNEMPGGSLTMIDAKKLVCVGKECYCYQGD